MPLSAVLLGLAAATTAAGVIDVEPRNAASVLTVDDYPRRELMNQTEGVVSFRARIAADGRVSACEVTETSGSENLDAVVCRAVLRRARFDKAEGPDPRQWRSMMRFTLSPDSLIGTVALALTVKTIPSAYVGRLRAQCGFDASGTVDDCSVVESSGAPSLDQQMLAEARARLSIPPPRAAEAGIEAYAWRDVFIALSTQ